MGRGPVEPRLTRVQRHIEQYRQGTATLEVRRGGRPVAGLPVFVDQENHRFRFGVVLAGAESLSAAQREHCLLRAHEVFNQVILPGEPIGAGNLETVEVSEVGRLSLGALRVLLDQSAGSNPRIVVVSGRTAGMNAPARTAMPEWEAGQRVVHLYTLCFSHPAVEGIVWKGFCDLEVGVAGAGLLRDDLAPTPAFQMLRKLVGTVWHSRAEGRTDSLGRFQFRGFFGDYRLAVPGGESAAIARFSLAPDSPPIVIEVAGESDREPS
jgi:hypothetical protein